MVEKIAASVFTVAAAAAAATSKTSVKNMSQNYVFYYY